jgi:Icc protein
MVSRPPHPDGNRTPTVLVQLSDLHLREGEDGAGPARRLQHAVRCVAALEQPPDAVLLSGDLADEPSSDAYEQAHELLSQLGVPLHAIPGNTRSRRSRSCPPCSPCTTRPC